MSPGARGADWVDMAVNCRSWREVPDAKLKPAERMAIERVKMPEQDAARSQIDGLLYLGRLLVEDDNLLPRRPKDRVARE